MTRDEVLARVRMENVRSVRFLYCDNANIVRGKAAHAGALADFIDAGIGLMVVITEGVPVQDTAEVFAYLQSDKNHAGTRMIGPNCPGVITPGEKCRVGIMPGQVFSPGRVGVISRSGTLVY